MEGAEPIWIMRIFMGALLLGMVIFAWCEISKARSVKRYYDSRRKAFDVQCGTMIEIAKILKQQQDQTTEKPEDVSCRKD